jgi:cellulose synthase/poly-beta-1,6-N-acetylglucosamine synthase-like glycosyltransferase
MDWSELIRRIVLTLYTFCLVTVCVYGFHRYVLLYLFYRHRRRTPRPAGRFDELPVVTVQLPMYNEQYVAKRVIEHTCRLDWPKDKLQIQVLDDSTDETVAIASEAVEQARADGFDIEYIRREDRTGYKAGALANGLRTARGEFVTIFDADFIPARGILRESIHYFTDPDVCAVQTRWEHINREDSLLTRTQAIFLDGHFAIEHVARNRSGRFMAFNGTAGTWRRAAIDDAGGWQHDTLTEDMDLSYRAQIRGWKFIFLPDLTAPAELPPEMSAFKAQQFRWTKGGAQTALKMLPRIMLSKAPLKAKIESFFHLTCFSVHALVLLLVTLLLPAMLLRALPTVENEAWRVAFDCTVFALATISGSVFYTASQYELFRDWRAVIKFLPFLIALGIGVTVSNTKAVLEALLGHKSEFVRTPKFGAGSAGYDRNSRASRPSARKRGRKLVPYIELAFGTYMLIGAGWCVTDLRMIMAAPFLLLFSIGYFYVAILTFQGAAAKAKDHVPVPEVEREP